MGNTSKKTKMDFLLKEYCNGVVSDYAKRKSWQDTVLALDHLVSHITSADDLKSDSLLDYLIFGTNPQDQHSNSHSTLDMPTTISFRGIFGILGSYGGTSTASSAIKSIRISYLQPGALNVRKTHVAS